MKQSDIKEYREAQLKKQRGVCPLCGTVIQPEEAVLDHCHDTGHVRKVLHRSCNAAEGRIKQWAGPRSRGDDPEKFLRNLIKYWKSEYSDNPVHPNHGKKRPRRRKRRR
jgi:hypothetical protein